MVEWVAIGVSGVALVISLASAWYSRREALAAEDSNWLAHPLDFGVSVAKAHSGAARLVVTYAAGLPLDDVCFEVPEDDEAPFLGFGVGKAESRSWTVGPMRVSDSVERGIVQALSKSGDGPPYISGPFRFRAVCRKGSRFREVSLTGEFSPQAWAY
jgi:hypothetical protein